MRPSVVVAVFLAGLREPARIGGLLLLLAFGCFAAFSVSGCMGCVQMNVQGQNLSGGDLLAAAERVGYHAIAAYCGVAVGLLSIGAVAGEIGSRAAQMVLARPVSRAEFLLARASLVVPPALILPFALAAAYAATFAFWKGVFLSDLFVGLLLQLPNLLAVGILAGALSLALPSVFSVMLVWGVYLASAVLSSPTVREALAGAGSPLWQALLVAADALLPPFGKVSALALAAVTDEPVSPWRWLAIPWQFGYLLLTMALALLAFRRKDL